MGSIENYETKLKSLLMILSIKYLIKTLQFRSIDLTDEVSQLY